MSSGTGTATSQNSGIVGRINQRSRAGSRAAGKENFFRKQGCFDCADRWLRQHATALSMTNNLNQTSFLGGLSPRYVITICTSFQASPVWIKARRTVAGERKARTQS